MKYFVGYKETKNQAGVTTDYTLFVWPRKNLFHVASQPMYSIEAENDEAAKTIAKEINNKNFIEWAARYLLMEKTPIAYDLNIYYMLQPWQRKVGIEELILNKLNEIKESGDLNYYEVNKSIGYIDDENEIKVLPADTEEEREMILEAAPWAAELDL
jgi:hypothetical protein